MTSENRKRDQGAHHGNGSQAVDPRRTFQTDAKSVLIGFLGPMTKQHTAYRQGDRFEALKHNVVEFTNAVGTSTATDDIKSEPMQVGKVDGSYYDGSRRTF